VAVDRARADNQTATVSPISVGSALPYAIDMRRYDFGAADLPTLQSYAAGVYDGKWVLIAGRTNGLHGFTSVGKDNFPVADQNREIWVIDPLAKQSWHRSLATDSAVSAQLLAELTPTNTEFVQVGDRLYMVGGYGAKGSGSGFTTHDALSAIDLAGIADWVVNGTGHATDHIRQLHGESFRVTGGAMYAMNGRMNLVFGQDFEGGYVPGSSGVYTNQVRRFDIVDNGTSLAIANVSASTPAADFRRRDLNVYPVVKRNTDASLGQGLVALSGVFTTTDGAWTVPVEIDQSGNPSMADPNLPGTFKQGMNNYHSAKLGLFSESANQMHEVLFGGISLEDYDRSTQTFLVDNNLPFINQITSILYDETSGYSQHLLGELPEILDLTGNRLRFGANAEFFLAPGVATYENGVIKLDALHDPTVLGYIFGGLFANAPNTRGVPGAVSGASNEILEVVFTPVPEPGTIVLSIAGVAMLALWRRGCRLRHEILLGLEGRNT
jgi:hypothetical protein